MRGKENSSACVFMMRGRDFKLDNLIKPLRLNHMQKVLNAAHLINIKCI